MNINCLCLFLICGAANAHNIDPAKCNNEIERADVYWCLMDKYQQSVIALKKAENVNHIVIYDMPQDLQDFFETADSCEGWIRDFNVHQEKSTYQFVEDSIKRDCSNIENKLLSMKTKYKNNKDYSARLTVYDDTIIIYDEYERSLHHVGAEQ